MHITVDARMIDASGIGRVIKNVLRRMIPQKAEWQFSLIGNLEKLQAQDFSKDSNCRVIPCDCPIYTIREQLLMPQIIPKDTDVYWSPHYNIPVFYQGRMVVTIHDLAHLALPEINKGILKHAYASLMFRAACEKADQIACVSQFTISELKKYIPTVQPSKIHLVYNGVDDVWSHIPDGPRLQVRPYFIYVGNIKPHKNLRFLIRAFQQAGRYMPYDLILVGRKDGFLTGEGNIEELLRGWEERIRFTGWVTDSQLQQYVAQSEAMIFPSLYEGFGLPPIEAMAAGKIVLVSDIPVMHEVCGTAAIYFDPHNTEDLVEKLMHVPSVPNAVGRQRAAMFSWEKTTNRMIDLMGK